MTQLESGTIVEVSEVAYGGELAADAPAGSTSITLVDAVDFNEDGGSIKLINDTTSEQLSYVSADLVSDVLTLTTGTVNAYVAGDMAEVVPRSVERIAQVQLDTGGESVNARVPHALFDRIAEGTRDADTEQRVSVQLDGSEWVIVDVLGTQPVVDGAFIDPDSLPAGGGAAPTSPPATPVISAVRPDRQGFTVVIDPIESGTLLTYYVNGAAVLTDTRATVVWISEDGSGTSFEPDTDYSITVGAHNDIGDGGVSAAVLSRLDIGIDPTTVLAKLNAALATFGKIVVGNITIDSDNGILVQLANGGEIRFPADGSQAVITAALNANSLSVEGFLRIMGETNTVEGTLRLSDVVVAPEQPASAYTTNVVANQSTSGSVVAVNWVVNGLYDQGTHWVTLVTNPGAGETGFTPRLLRLNKSTGGVTTHNLTGRPTGSKNVVSFGGFNSVGDTFYVLSYGADWSTFRVEWYSAATYAYINRTTITNPTTGAINPPPQLAVPSDGFFYLAWLNYPDNKLRVDRWTTTGTTRTTQVLSSFGVAGGNEINWLWIGNGDFGARRFIIGQASTAYVFTAGNPAPEQTTEEFSNYIGGLHYSSSAGRFYSISSTGYFAEAFTVYQLAKNKTAVNRTVKYTFYDSDAAGTGTHETNASPSKTFSQPPRTPILLSGDKPLDTGDPDDPDRLRWYVDAHLQAEQPAGAYQYTFLEPGTTGADAPATNGFAAASAHPGKIKSTSANAAGRPFIELQGNGQARLSKLIQCGAINLPASGAANTGVSATVTFPDPFDSIPDVLVCPSNAANTVRLRAWSSDNTTTGFTLRGVNEIGTGAFTVRWVAIARAT